MKNQIPIFVISLKNAKSRRVNIQHQMNGLGLKFSFFDAVEGVNPDVIEENRYLIDQNWREKRRGDPLTPSEIGCALSHAFVYKKMIDENLTDAIVIEDDAIIGSAFRSVALREMEFPKRNLVILHVYKQQYAKKVTKSEHVKINDNYSLYSPYGRFSGACGYYVTKEAAQVLYDAAIPVWMTSDWPLDIAKELGAMGIEPAVVFHSEEFESQIQFFKGRKIPRSIILMRLLFFPTIFNPQKYGSPYKSLYAWQAIKRRLMVRLFARRPRNAV